MSPRDHTEPVPHLGRGVTFVARVHSLCQQHAAQLTPRALRVPHLDQVRRHAERVVANLVLVVFPNTAEEGLVRGLRL